MALATPSLPDDQDDELLRAREVQSPRRSRLGKETKVDASIVTFRADADVPSDLRGNDVLPGHGPSPLSGDSEIREQVLVNDTLVPDIGLGSHPVESDEDLAGLCRPRVHHCVLAVLLEAAEGE